MVESSDFLDLVDELTLGRKDVRGEPLLSLWEQFEESVHPTKSSGVSRGGTPVPASLEVIEVWMDIRFEVTHRLQQLALANPPGDMRRRIRWWANREPDQAYGRDAVMRWVKEIQKITDPVKTIVLHSARCPACKFSTAEVIESDEKVTVPALKAVFASTPYIVCRECGAEWVGLEEITKIRPGALSTLTLGEGTAL